MSIVVLSTVKNVEEYLAHVKNAANDFSALWSQYVVDPIWPTLSQYAPFDLSDRKPEPIDNLDVLFIQNSRLASMQIDALQKELEHIARLLPMEDEAPTFVALYPLDDSNIVVKEKQNGVVGSSIFGNIILNINPFAQDWERWVPYVFAHEYHHCVWGDYWFSVRRGEGVTNSFLEYLINEGQADYFAGQVFPDLKPQWNQPYEADLERSIWSMMQPVLESTDFEVHQKYMFGSEALGIPWCAGYSIGSAIIKSYVINHPLVTYREMIQLSAKDILSGSRFAP